MSPLEDVLDELSRITDRWVQRGRCEPREFYASPHELLGVLREEGKEFEASVFCDLPSYVELMQVAAVAIRGMEWLVALEPSLVRAQVDSYSEKHKARR